MVGIKPCHTKKLVTETVEQKQSGKVKLKNSLYRIVWTQRIDSPRQTLTECIKILSKRSFNQSAGSGWWVVWLFLFLFTITNGLLYIVPRIEAMACGMQLCPQRNWKESINQKIAPNMMVTSAWNVTDYAWKREIWFNSSPVLMWIKWGCDGMCLS